MRLSEQLRAPKVSISFSMGRQRRGGLITDRALAIARYLHDLGRNNREQVQKIEIAGFNDAEEKLVIDLIEERIVETMSVRPDVNRTISYATRRNAVRRAWENRRQELADMFGQR